MKYDISNSLHREQARKRLEALLCKEHGIIELSEVKPQRSIKQNKYLHLLLGFFASEYGETIEYVKEQYFKLAANRSIFLRERDDKLAGHGAELPAEPLHILADPLVPVQHKEVLLKPSR